MKRRFFYDVEFIEYPSTIDLISIGIVGEDDSEFYAISNEFDESKANEWVKENVLPQLPNRKDPLWQTRKQIARGVLDFLNPSESTPVELWGYYADYDHVALCWLFGAMVDLPVGMPMFTLDVQQLCYLKGDPAMPAEPDAQHNALADARWIRQAYEMLMEQ